MRSRTLSNVLTVVAAGSIVASSPSGHKRHKHPHQVEGHVPDSVKTVNVPGPTMVAYELNGNPISENEVCDGIREGTLKWVEGKDGPLSCPGGHDFKPSSPSAVNSINKVQDYHVEKTQPKADEGASEQPKESNEAHDRTGAQIASSKSASSQYTAEPLASKTLAGQISSSTQAKNVRPSNAADSAKYLPPAVSTSSELILPAPTSKPVADGSGRAEGLEKDFPDGTIDCSSFPQDYGPIKIGWAGLGGWSGIQYVTIEGSSISHIDTATPGGAGCKRGAMCSYACPPGYQKSQWPSTQGATGQSVGGLHCDEDGKLRLTNSRLSRKLCIPGTGATKVENRLSNNAAICRTDYPGTENEVVPLDTQPETVNPLTCPDATTYFKHLGRSTTAQYYINNQGVPLQQACIWGADGSNMGNWAPSYLGVGQDLYGKTFLAIASTAQNDPTNYKPLNFTVEIVGHTTGKCRLKHGRYCTGDNYDRCNDKGCTIELLSGEATYVLSD